jgi:hypothetical protein
MGAKNIMGFSTIAQLKKNLVFASGAITATSMTANIQDADNELKDDLSKYLDWTDVLALTYVPRVINRLSQYKACELTVARQWLSPTNTLGGESEDTQNYGYQYWINKYDLLLDQIKRGDIEVLDSNNDAFTTSIGKVNLGLGRII